ncbi:MULTISPECIES: GNAT family N-acetyltransferase [unclassified Bacillus (in: firmicutes)]|uniref:GNAT family N-acetyltransferase n=1 Tax=unclassified Bacillus (in: firmicutes) TaxID=185979 RepID=UPI0008E31948|nr:MULTISPECIES: GNAT family N-acetyltransferase [unclassified Bacillus (in: firmicutes)]SFA89963.1 Acetyltransferase (GNAT) family protein [Bacillus sp. UNCCL13]SFQ85100.1 Acetyltransferase (GNAT) family protein [Bacillus sp. cl95]
MINIKRLSECSVDKAVKAWNVGFEGYFFDATTNADAFLNRMVMEGLSTKLSVVAFHDQEPIGIVLSGIREVNGEKIAWNGGTGVAKDFRKKGVGKLMMEASFTIYREEGVKLATLEAISENENAIKLYESIGYQIVDELEYLEMNGSQDESPFGLSVEYKLQRLLPQQAGLLSFYKGGNPWQTQWQSAKGGEAITLVDESGIEAGYAYYRRSLDEKGNHVATVLFQCEANPECKDPASIIESLLHHVFGNCSESIKRVVPNMPVKKSKETSETLKSFGFKPTVKQVMMVKEMSN